MTTVIVIAKAPIAGQVKTRLCPPCTPEEAAAVAGAALIDTLSTVDAFAADRAVIALDGPAGTWVPPRFEVIAQRGGPLEERLAAAFEDAMGTDPTAWQPTVLIGMDTPQVTHTDLKDAFNALAGHGSSLGLTPDGGWWCIGLHAPNAEVFRDVIMSEPTTGQRQLERLDALGLAPVSLRELADVDFFPDALHVASLIPLSTFAREVGLIHQRVTQTAPNDTWAS